MAESSYFWTTGGAGDGASTYTRTDLSNAMKVIAACMSNEGIAPAMLNVLIGSTTGVNNARIASGGAIVDGKPYLNTANVDVTIPSASGGGNTRIDRIVLRADWTAQTVRVTRIAGTDAASPTAPTITQNTGVVWDTQICQALVNTAGTVTITDERTFARPGPDTITETALRGLIVSSGKIAANAVIAGKLADGSVDTTARLANDIVDDTKVGNRVAALTARQGSSANNWNTAGATNQTVTTVRMEAGTATVPITAGNTSGTLAITLPTAFSFAPIIFLAPTGATPPSDFQAVFSDSVAAGSFNITAYRTGTTGTVNITVQWLAIGPE